MTVAPLELDSVSCHYGRRQVLFDVSLAMAPGVILGLIGLNGAGKSTLIKAVLNLVTASRGTIRVFGEPHTACRCRRHLAFLPELCRPSRALTGWEFLGLGLGFFRVPLDRARAAAIAERLGVGPALLRQRVTTYSKGMGQKLGLIGALLADRPLLVLDEPMSGLDPLARVQVKSELLAYRAAGRSVFMSSHILADLDELCDEIAVIDQGRLTFVGGPGALRARVDGGSLERAFLAALAADARCPAPQTPGMRSDPSGRLR